MREAAAAGIGGVMGEVLAVVGNTTPGVVGANIGTGCCFAEAINGLLAAAVAAGAGVMGVGILIAEGETENLGEDEAAFTDACAAPF